MCTYMYTFQNLCMYTVASRSLSIYIYMCRYLLLLIHYLHWIVMEVYSGVERMLPFPFLKYNERSLYLNIVIKRYGEDGDNSHYKSNVINNTMYSVLLYIHIYKHIYIYIYIYRDIYGCWVWGLGLGFRVQSFGFNNLICGSGGQSHSIQN